MVEANIQQQTLDRVKAVWEKFPKLRFMQLVLNATNCRPGVNCYDPFYTTDDQLVEALEAYATKYGR